MVVPKSYDIIGSREKAVAVIEDSAGVKAAAEALMKRHKNVASVLVKASPRAGAYRTRAYRLVAGSSDTEVLHKEHGFRFLLDPQRAYFSPREGTERKKIADTVGKKETVMVFFAGIGPYAVQLAKRCSRVIAIELNPVAVSYLKKNAALNKAQNITAVEGDVAHAAQAFYGACDRVVMPLPESALKYLGEAVQCIGPAGIIHLYCIADKSSLGALEMDIKKRIEKGGRSVKSIVAQQVLPYSPRTWKYRIDIEIR